jgi:hypothetical protein
MAVPALLVRRIPIEALVALPFLMDLLGVPHDYFQLYIPASIVTGKFDSMTAAMSLFALALVSAAAVSGFLRWNALRLIGHGLLALAIIVIALVGTRAVLASSIDTLYRKDRLLTGMHLTRSPVTVVVRNSAPASARDPALGLERIRQRGTLRVGFTLDQLPFAFYNLRGDLVGMDVELAGLLARDLGVPAVEFIPGDATKGPGSTPHAKRASQPHKGVRSVQAIRLSGKRNCKTKPIGPSQAPRGFL